MATYDFLTTIKRPKKITSMTLRGFGSYLHGKRLETRPITIICGENGSGKSTWFRAIRLLRESSGNEGFPFTWRMIDDDTVLLYANSFVFQRSDRWIEEGYHDDLKNVKIPGEDEKFGEFGSIGLAGSCDTGDSFELRFTIPEISPVGAGLVRLRVGKENFLFEKPADCSRYSFRAFTDGEAPNVSTLVGEYDCSMNRFFVTPGGHGCDPLDLFSAVRSLIQILVSGLFYLGAIRRILSPKETQDMREKYLSSIQSAFNNEIVGRLDESSLRDVFDQITSTRSTHNVGVLGRSVSDDGAQWDLLHYCYAGKLMVQWSAPRSGLLEGKCPAVSREANERIRVECERIGIGRDEVVSPYLFETYFCYWMERLVGAYPAIATFEEYGMHFEWCSGNPPDGYLLYCPSREVRLRLLEVDLEEESADRYYHKCYGGTGLTTHQQNMSAGFHQIAPMVVQLGLMERGECLCFENPEVHIHPKLQSELIEYFFLMARSGRTILVETHSDIVVLQTMRLMLEEVLPQESIRIYFTTLAATDGEWPGENFHSHVERIRVNSRGRIINWPEGFMDTHGSLSERLLDLVYGDPERDEEIEGGRV